MYTPYTWNVYTVYIAGPTFVAQDHLIAVPLLGALGGAEPDPRKLAAALDAAPTDTAGVVTSSLPTISKTRIVGRTQQLLRLDIESREAPSGADIEHLRDRVLALVEKVH